MRILAVVVFYFFGMNVVVSQTSTCFDVARRGSLSDMKRLYEIDHTIVDSVDKNKSSMLILACYYGNEAVVDFLIEKVSAIDYNSGMGTALMASVVKGNTKIVEKLLRANCNIDAVDDNQTSALHYAVLFKDISMVKLLLEFRPDLSLKDVNGKTAFEFAVASNNEALLSLLKH